MRFKNLVEVFSTCNPNLKVDKKLIQELHGYISSFMSKNENHSAFFSNVLVGVNKVAFTTSDLNEFYNSILEMDKQEVKENYHEHLLSVNRRKYDPKYLQVAGDPTNAVMLYLCHLIKTSTLINDKEKEVGITYVLMILQIKFLTSLLNNYYPYPVDKELAISAYNRLSRRFILRRYNTWKDVLVYRSHTFFALGRKGNEKFNRVFDTLETLQDFLDCITGVQTAVRRSLIEYNQVFYQVKDEDDRIVSSKALGLDAEGDAIVVDKVAIVNTYRHYLTKITPSEKDFIKDELVDIVAKQMSGTRYKPIHKVLRYISSQYNEDKDKIVREFVDESGIFILDYLKRNNVNTRDLIATFKKLQGALSSNRTLDDNLLLIRAAGDDIASLVLEKKKYNSTVVSTRTAVILYIAMRMLTMNHYN